MQSHFVDVDMTSHCTHEFFATQDPVVWIGAVDASYLSPSAVGVHGRSTSSCVKCEGNGWSYELSGQFLKWNHWFSQLSHQTKLFWTILVRVLTSYHHLQDLSNSFWVLPCLATPLENHGRWSNGVRWHVWQGDCTWSPLTWMNARAPCGKPLTRVVWSSESSTELVN